MSMLILVRIKDLKSVDCLLQFSSLLESSLDLLYLAVLWAFLLHLYPKNVHVIYECILLDSNNRYVHVRKDDTSSGI